LAVKLLIVPRLNIPSVVLVEVVKLIVDVNRLRDLGESSSGRAGQGHGTSFAICAGTVIIIPDVDLGDLLREHSQDNSCGKENNAENTESQHGGHSSGHGSPSWKGLLLESRVFEGIDLVLDGLLLRRISI
jgi:hypothetical protein